MVRKVTCSINNAQLNTFNPLENFTYFDRHQLNIELLKTPNVVFVIPLPSLMFMGKSYIGLLVIRGKENLILINTQRAPLQGSVVLIVRGHGLS